MSVNQLLNRNALIQESPKSGEATQTSPSQNRVQLNQSDLPKHRTLVKSVAWSAAGDWGTQIFTWLVFLKVVRLLSPVDFGIAAMSAILMPYMGQLTGMGLPRAAVALRDLTEDQLAQMNTLSVLSASTLFLFGIAIAKPFAEFFKTPALAPVFIVACSGLILSALCGVPNAILAKQMRFRLLSVLGISCTLISAFATLGMAWFGFKYWALLLGNMVAGVFRVILVLRARPLRFSWPRYKEIREPLQYGWQISVSLIAMNSYQRLDNFVAGKMLGPAALGFYGNAWELANVPIEKVASLFTTVIPSYLSAVQDQPVALRRYLSGLTEVIALGAFPGTVGLAVVAPEFVPVVLGPKWSLMVAPLQVLSFYAGFRAIMALLPKILWAIGRVRYVMWNDLAALVLLPISFYIGSYRGTVGIAWAWVVAYPFIVLPLYYTTFRAIGMKIGEYVRALIPATNATIVMGIVVTVVRHALDTSRPLIFRLAVEVIVGLLVYFVTLWFVHRDRVLALIQIAKRQWKAKPPLASSAR